MENLKKIELSYGELNTFVLDKNEDIFLSVISNGVKFEFIIKRRIKSENLIIFGSGAYNINKLSPPIFQRYSWNNDFDENIIYFNDPTLYLADITLGWGYGTREIHYLNIIYKIIEKLTISMKIEKRNSIIYGSSGGGFMAIILATLLKGSTALVNNPQTDISKYHLSQIRKLFDEIYSNEDIDNIFKLNKDRINVVDFFFKEEYVPKIVYYQNMACEFDMKNQFYPFIENMKRVEEKYFFQPIDIRLYFNKEENHNPLSKNKTINIIKNQIKVNNEIKNIIEIKDDDWIEFSKRNKYSLFRYEKKIPKKLIGSNYQIFNSNRCIDVLDVKKIEKAGFGELYDNNHLYISVEHKEIKNTEIFNDNDIKNYFKNNTFIIYY